MSMRMPLYATTRGLVGVSVWLLGHSVLAAETYTVVDLGTLGGNQALALAINDGLVVGWSETTVSPPFARHAFVWTQPGGMVDLGTFGGSDSYALGVSNGQVVGWAQTPEGYHHAFIWSEADGLTDLGTLGGP